MYSKCLLYSLTLISFLTEAAFGQRQFQKRYGLNYSVHEVRNIKYSPRQTTVLFGVGDCFDISHVPSCLYFGLMAFDTSDNVKYTYQLHPVTTDTTYRMSYFEQLIENKFICVGSSSSVSINASIVITDSNFSFIKGMTYKFGGTSVFIKTIPATGNNFYYVIGQIDSLNQQGTNSTLLCKVDSGLQIEWSKIYSTPYGSTTNDFSILPNGNLILCGTQLDSNIYFSHIFLWEIDTTGSIVWSKKYSTNTIKCQGFNIYTLPNGIILNSSLNDSVVGGLGLMKFDLSGNLIWNKVYTFQGGNIDGMIKCADNGSLISCLYANAGLGAACLLKTDSTGNLEWNYYYENGDWNLFSAEKSNHEFITIGQSPMATPSGMKNFVYMVKTDTAGISGCSEFTFPISVDSVTITASNQTVFSNDYVPNISNFYLISDTFPLQELTFCDALVNTNAIMENEMQLIAYPNPTNDFINITFSSERVQSVVVTLTDITGQIKIRKKIKYDNQNRKLDISEFSSGIYFLSVKNDGVNSTIKIVKL